MIFVFSGCGRTGYYSRPAQAWGNTIFSSDFSYEDSQWVSLPTVGVDTMTIDGVPYRKGVGDQDAFGYQFRVHYLADHSAVDVAALTSLPAGVHTFIWNLSREWPYYGLTWTYSGSWTGDASIAGLHVPPSVTHSFPWIGRFQQLCKVSPFTPPPGTYLILNEDGTYILLESNDKIEVE